MNIFRLIRAMEGLDARKDAPTDAVGHTYSADARVAGCTRCGVSVPSKRQYTVVECPGRASTLDEYAARKVDTAPADTKPVAETRTR